MLQQTTRVRTLQPFSLTFGPFWPHPVWPCIAGSTYRDKQPFTLQFTALFNFEGPGNLMCISLDCGRKPGHPPHCRLQQDLQLILSFFLIMNKFKTKHLLITSRDTVPKAKPGSHLSTFLRLDKSPLWTTQKLPQIFSHAVQSLLVNWNHPHAALNTLSCSPTMLTHFPITKYCHILYMQYYFYVYITILFSKLQPFSVPLPPPSLPPSLPPSEGHLADWWWSRRFVKRLQVESCYQL